MKILKLLLLLSAAVTVILRLFSYENTEFMAPETVKLLNIISIVSACVCVVCALIWIIIIKAEQKKGAKK